MSKTPDPSDLLEAASGGHVEEVHKLLHVTDTDQSAKRDYLTANAKGASVDVTNSLGKTALCLAVERGHLVAVQTLVRAGSQVNKTYDTRRTPLMLAVAKGHGEIVDVLIKAGSELDRVDSFGMSAVMEATERGNLDCLSQLIDAGANLRLRDIRRKSAMMIATEKGQAKCLQKLIEADTDLKSINSWGDKLLECAVLHGRDNCVRTLVQAGASTDGTYSYTKSTLLILAVDSRTPSCVRELVQSGINVDLVNSEGKTALMMAAATGQHGCLQILIEAGADLDKQDMQGNTALMLAATSGFDKCVQCLITGGADAKQIDKKGKTALMLACLHKKHSCVELLLKVRPNQIDEVCLYGKTALIYAAETYDERCLRLLVQAGADVNLKTFSGNMALLSIVKTEGEHGPPAVFAECVKFLVDSGADVNGVDVGGHTPLMYCAVNENLVDTLSLLLKAGALVDKKDHIEMTAISHAVKRGAPQCVQCLVEAGGSVNVLDSSCKSPLHYLIEHRDMQRAEQCLKILLSKQANVNAQDKDGVSPLMIMATKSSAINIMSLLLEHGAEINHVNNIGCSAFTYACMSHEECLDSVNFLLQKGAKPILKVLSRTVFSQIGPGRQLSLLKFLIEHNIEFDLPWEDFRILVVGCHREMLQLLVTNGLIPIEKSVPFGLQTQSCIMESVLKLLAERKEIASVKYLLATCYLRNADLEYIFSPDQPNRKGRTFLHRNLETETLIESLRSQPWPLVKLCFIAVSSALGASPERYKRTKNSQLPNRLQDMLLFQEPVSKLCNHQWDKIPLSIKPEDYENLPRPRPLLYHWPIGRAVVPCDCGRCENMYKFEG